MERNYNVGSDSNAITLQVNTGTAAMCYTIANQVLSGGQKVFKADSPDGSNGAIAITNIGSGADLKNTEIVIQTIADFSALPQDVIDSIKQDPHSLKNKLVIEYIFSGGATGKQHFDYDNDDFIISSDGKLVVVTKKIKMIQ